MQTVIRIKQVIGVLFICVGVFTTKIVLEKFISPYAIAELNNRIPINFINVSFIVIGFLLIVVREDYFLPPRIFRFYKLFAIAFTTICLFLLLVSSLFCVCHFVKDISLFRDQIFFSYNKPLKEVYPNYSSQELRHLLYETWSRPYVYEPYIQFKEKPFKGKYINVHKAGFRLTRNQGTWPPDKGSLNIFLFGGSSTFGYGVSDTETISSYLQSFLSDNLSGMVYVYNFGCGHYFSTQERILFEKLLTKGFVPDVAVFLDGLNDFYYYNNKPLGTKRLRKYVNKKHKFNLIDNLRKVVSCPYKGKCNDKDLIKSVVSRYLANKRLIETVAHSYGVQTLFVWEPAPTYKYDLKYHIFSGRGFGRFLYSKHGYAYMEELSHKRDLGKDFLWLANIQEDLKKSLYVDTHHYSAYLTRMVAERIYNFLINHDMVKK